MKKVHVGKMVSLILLITCLAGCMDDGKESRQVTDYKEYTLTVASEKRMGLGWSDGMNYETEVYAVKHEGTEEWEDFAYYIDGFDYEEGYEYCIHVGKTSYLDYSMGDPAWSEYNLIKVISKERKDSEGLPENFIPNWYKEETN